MGLYARITPTTWHICCVYKLQRLPMKRSFTTRLVLVLAHSTHENFDICPEMYDPRVYVLLQAKAAEHHKELKGDAFVTK